MTFRHETSGATALVMTTILLAFWVPSSSFAADIFVPQDATTIESAIDLAVDGDRVIVAPGTYAERIDFSGKGIVVESVGGAEVTVIDGGGASAGAGHVVTFASGETRAAVLRGFTVTGGFGSGGSFGDGEGGGILVDGTEPRIEDCAIVGNSGVDGGGLEARNGDLLVIDTVFRDNEATQGGGLYAVGGRVTIEGGEFVANDARDGGGAAFDVGTEAVVRDARFERNGSRQFGGGLFARHCDLDAARLTFVDNGTVRPTSDGVGQVFSTLGGGAAYVTSVSGGVTTSRSLGDAAAFGPGMYIAGGSEDLVVSNTLVARSNGTAAMYFNDSSPLVVNCTIAEPEGILATLSTFGAFPVLQNTVIQGTLGGSGDALLEYCLVEGPAGIATVGTGTVFGDAGLDADEDWQPLPGSTVIDAGSNAAVPASATTDLLGNGRFFDDPATPDTGAGEAPIVDIGAFEFGSGDVRAQVVTSADRAPARLLTTVGVAPNPFNPRTVIGFELERDSSVRVDVFDPRGRLVTTLVSRELRSGAHSLTWDGTDRDGRSVATGTYLAVVRAAQESRTVKMTLVR